MASKPWDSRLAHALILPLRHTRVHPNHVTTLALLVGLGAAALYATALPWGAYLGAACWILACILDHADGELARLTGKVSVFGHRYDRAADLIVKLALFVGMGASLRNGPLHAWGVLLGLLGGTSLVAIFVSRSTLAQRRGPQALAQPHAWGFEIEDILYLIAPLTWLGLLGPFLVAVAIGTPVFASWLIWRSWTLAGLDSPATARVRAMRVGGDAGGSVTDLQSRRGVRSRKGHEDSGSFTSDGIPVPRFAYPGLVVGLALFAALLAAHGAADVVAALRAAGFGLVVVAAFHVLPMLADALGWRRLLPSELRPPVGTMLRARWIGESVNGLLPVLQVGGNIVKAGLLARTGVGGGLAGASVVVDVTLVMLSQVIFTIIGLFLLLLHLGGHVLALPVAVGVVVMGSIVAAFYALQRQGVFGALAQLIAKLGRGRWTSLAAGGDAIDASVSVLYRQRRTIASASMWHLLSWVVGVGEVWLALFFLGHPVRLLSAMMMESLGQAVRAAAFAVPGALGVQEGGYVMLGGVLGIGPETALALSLSKRVRELLLGIPGLIAWQLDAVNTESERQEARSA
jgi:putative membrane protein